MSHSSCNVPAVDRLGVPASQRQSGSHTPHFGNSTRCSFEESCTTLLRQLISGICIDCSDSDEGMLALRALSGDAMQSERPGCLSPQCFVVSRVTRTEDRVPFSAAAASTSQSYHLVRLGVNPFEKPCALHRCRAKNGEPPHLRNTLATRQMHSDPRRRKTFAHRSGLTARRLQGARLTLQRGAHEDFSRATLCGPALRMSDLSFVICHLRKSRQGE